MARPKGSNKTPGSGRKAGTPNQDTALLKQKARELGIDPFEILLLFAKNDWKALGYESQKITIFSRNHEPIEVDVITPETRLKAASDACQYLYPKRKSIEHEHPTKQSNGKKIIQINWADQDEPNRDSENEKANASSNSDK